MFYKMLFAFAVTWSMTCFACESSVSGRLDIQTIDSKIFPYPHVLRVWLPSEYSKPENKLKKYPVLYLLDGQNLFDKCTSYIGVEWHVDETISRLIKEGKMPPVIVVGLDNAGDKRAKEYLPFDDPFNPEGAGTQGKLFPQFLRHDVMPYIKAHYRIKMGSENTAIGGSSYGGIAALNVTINDPLLASKVLIESPSLQVGNGAFLRESVNLVHSSPRIYLGVGTNETKRKKINNEMLAGVHVLAENLSSSFNSPAVQLNIGKGESHNESAWSRRLPQALIFLYGTADGNVKVKTSQKTKGF